MVNKKLLSYFFLIILLLNTTDFNLSAKEPEAQIDQFVSQLGFFKQSMKLAKRLPEDCKKLVLQAWDSCDNLSSNQQNPILFLFDITQKLVFKNREMRNKLSPDQLKDLFDSLYKTLIAVQRFLNLQDFQVVSKRVFAPGVFNQDLKNQMSDLSTELDQILKKLEQEDFDTKDVFTKGLQVIKESFDSLVLGDFNIFAKHHWAYLQEKSKGVLQLLNSAELMLNVLFEKLKPEEKDLKEAIIFWQESLKEFNSFKNYFTENFAKDKGLESFCIIVCLFESNF